MNVALWILQGLLSALFIFGGSTKLAMPIEELVAATGVPGWLLILASVCEVLGGLGLVLPGIVRIYRFLTPLAAAGLVVIMTVATGLLTAFVAYGRSHSITRPARAAQPILEPIG